MLVLRMVHRKLKESKQQPSMWPGPAVPGCCLVSFHILWAILSTSTVIITILFQKTARKSADLGTETATMAGRRVDARRPRSTTAAAAAAERTVGGLRVLFSGIPAAGMSS